MHEVVRITYFRKMYKVNVIEEPPVFPVLLIVGHRKEKVPWSLYSFLVSCNSSGKWEHELE